MKFSRTYSAPGDPYAGVAFEPRTSKIVNPDGSVIFEAKDVMVPAVWSQVAVDVLAQKYCRKAGVPTRTVRVGEEGVPEWLSRSVADGTALDTLSRDDQFGPERDARQVFNRMAGCWTYWGWKHGYFDTENDAQIYYDEMCAMLARQIGAPNSPQWFNTGLHWAYGISGPAQGHWYVDPGDHMPKPSADTFTHPQVSACYILGIEDDLVNEGGIFDGVLREARIFKGGSGSGANFSKLRASGEKLTGGGTSSGLMSFLKVFDRAAGAIKSGGTTRRAAKMVVLNADHPDIEEFVNWKVREERKVADLVIGARVFERNLNAIISAAHDTRVPESARLDPALNASLRQAIRDAITAGIPSGAAQNALDYARQGYTRLEVEQYDTAWDSEAYVTVSGQNSNNSVRLSNAFFDALEGDADWLSDLPHDRRRRQARQSARPLGADRRRGVAVRRPGPAVRRHDSRVAHLFKRRSHQRNKSMRHGRYARCHGRRPRPHRRPRRQSGLRHRRRRPAALRQQNLSDRHEAGLSTAHEGRLRAQADRRP